MSYNSTNEYMNIVDRLIRDYNISENIASSLQKYVVTISRAEIQNHFSAPMFWIGMYIAGASLVCILAMVADLLHGFRSRKSWFPCRYFRINAAFLTVISVAMKLPVDLTGSMMGQVDKVAKLGSMAFMCTMMANLLPCLATMGSNELLSNVIALGVLVITLVVNVCIQIQTGVISTYMFSIADFDFSPPLVKIVKSSLINTIASIYVICLVVLLMVHVCSSIATLKSKKIIETKYQQVHEKASKKIQSSPVPETASKEIHSSPIPETTSEEIHSSPRELLTFEKLEEHVISHWIMAGSGNPQFITACFHTTSASGVICFLVLVLHNHTIFSMVFHDNFLKNYDSDYGWSMIVILIVQFIGVGIGTIAPLYRCFATLSFKGSSKIISKHFKVFKVERYWTRKLYDWKHASIRLPFRGRNPEVVIETLQRLIFNIFIGLQYGVVVVCKLVALIPFLFMICVLFCFLCIKGLLKAVFGSLGKKFENLEGNNDLRPYVLQLDDEIELGEKMLKRLSKSVNLLIQKGAKSQPKNLMKLILGKSTSSFEGVKKFDSIDYHDVPCVDCWSLPVVTLTTIAISLPKIEKEEVDSLLESVKEGLNYVTLVETSLSVKDGYVSFQKAANTQWQEIRFDKKWLGNKLQNPDFQVNTSGQIVEWFRDKAKNIVFPEDRSDNNTGGDNDDSIRKSICANSMYRITETILLTCHTNNDATVSQKELFDSLSSMIADIIAACLTNLPQVITMKCNSSVIEQREDSVKDAAQLLGETTEIIRTLQGHNIPNMDPKDLPFIEKWRAYLGNP